MTDNIAELIEDMEPRLRRAFLEAVDGITSEAQLRLIAGHLENGDIDAAMRVLDLKPGDFGPLDDLLDEGFRKGGRAAMAGFPVVRDPASGGKSRSVSTRAIHAPRRKPDVDPQH